MKLNAGFCSKVIRKLFLPLLFLCIIALLSNIFLSLESIFHVQQHTSSGANITILLWYWPFGIPYSLKGDVCLQTYRISACHLVDNRSLYDEADIVVFHHHELKLGRQKLPHHFPRPAHQRWLWVSLEAPENNGNLTQHDKVFNLTMSYRPDSDITVPYGKLEDQKNGTAIAPMHKTHLVCWVVSNYRKVHRRTRVVHELRRTIPIHVYGRAVNKTLTKDELIPTISSCYFYLAFENTESRHYITEKLWRNAFMAGTVPVVLGPPRRDYEAVAPPHSFIHVDDFQSVHDLAQFLKELANDAKRYKSYFTWHLNYSVKLYVDWRERLCNICPVYDTLPSHQIYQKLHL